MFKSSLFFIASTVTLGACAVDAGHALRIAELERRVAELEAGTGTEGVGMWPEAPAACEEMRAHASELGRAHIAAATTDEQKTEGQQFMAEHAPGSFDRQLCINNLTPELHGCFMQATDMAGYKRCHLPH